MKFFISAIFSVFILSSCAVVDVIEDNTMVSGLVAYQASRELIEAADEPMERARRVILYTEAALRLVDADQTVTIDALYDEIYQLIDWNAIPPQDRFIVEDLLVLVRARISEEINRNVAMSAEQAIALRHVIERIRIAAEQFLIAENE